MESPPTEVHVSNMNYQEQPNNKNHSSEEDQNSANESEYDSAGSYSDDEQGKRKGQDNRGSGEQSDGDDVAPERESGDGQESLPQKKVDDDEDKKNPQYIPKRGTFYEHDDRTLDEAESAAKIENEKEKDGKKKIWHDKKEKWSHDRFNDSEQMPKTKSELVSIYGYDIRNEEGPPRARRRRRYGRGPNKYTRNWEDEDAYNKPPATRIKKPPPKDREQMELQEEFPPLENTRVRSTRSQEFRNKTINKSPKNSQDQNISNNSKPPDRIERSEHRENPDTFKPSPRPSPRDPPSRPVEHKPQRVGSGRVIKPQREIKDSDYKGFTSKSRQNRNFSVTSDQQIIIKSHNAKDYGRAQKSDSLDEITRDMGSMNMQDNGYKGKYGGGSRQGSMPPRLQNEQKGGKRYSSMRQRSLPETANPPQFNQHANYYSGEYQPPQGVQQQQQPPQNLIPATTTAVPAQMLAAPLAIPPQQQVPVTAAAMMQAAQPQFPPPPFAQPGAALFQPAPPPPFIAQQQPQLINYPPQFPPGYQGFQQQFSPVVSQSLNIIEQTPPTELYQPQGGITYYSTDQQLMQRSVPQKRPKAAIPIVPPPDVERGRTSREDDQSSISPSGGDHQLSEYMIEDAINAGYVQENNNLVEQ